MSLEPGSVIGANIRLARKLGEGGMGSVWVADHLTLQTQVAIKFMSEALTRDEAAVERFTREATAAAQIKSRHVVQILDSGVMGEGVPYIVMELLVGEDLGAQLARIVMLPLDEATTVIVQACKALTQAHARGIVHRDIKPENIFLTQSDGELVAKVLDFGIAKRMDVTSFSATSTGSMMGTPLYMSPEQVLSSKHVSDRSDMWSLGVVAYHTLTGVLPFNGETIGAICIAINSCVYVPPSRLREGLPPAVDGWMARALARDPAQRFATAKEMADELVVAMGSHTPAFRGSFPALSLPATTSAAPQAEAAAVPSAIESPLRAPAPSGEGQLTFMGAAMAGPRSSARPAGKRAGWLALAAGVAALGVLIVAAVVVTHKDQTPATGLVSSPSTLGSGLAAGLGSGPAPTSPPAVAPPSPPAPESATPAPAVEEPASTLPVVDVRALPVASATTHPSPGTLKPVVKRKDRGF